jgi:hypothetical protein
VLCRRAFLDDTEEKGEPGNLRIRKIPVYALSLASRGQVRLTEVLKTMSDSEKRMLINSLRGNLCKVRPTTPPYRATKLSARLVAFARRCGAVDARFDPITSTLSGRGGSGGRFDITVDGSLAEWHAALDQFARHEQEGEAAGLLRFLGAPAQRSTEAHPSGYRPVQYGAFEQDNSRTIVSPNRRSVRSNGSRPA